VRREGNFYHNLCTLHNGYTLLRDANGRVSRVIIATRQPESSVVLLSSDPSQNTVPKYVSIRDAARATCAAPLYFAPVKLELYSVDQ
jgi:hypothetical protein